MKSTVRQRNLLLRAWKECKWSGLIRLVSSCQNNLGVTTVRGEIKAGYLVVRKVGRRTIITAEDTKAWQEGLPKKPRVRAPDGVR